MVEDWELKALRGELNRLELRFERAERDVVDFKELRRSVERLERKEQQRFERRQQWWERIAWTCWVALLTTYVVLSVTG